MVERLPMAGIQQAESSGWRTETYGPPPGIDTVRDPRFSDGSLGRPR